MLGALLGTKALLGVVFTLVIALAGSGWYLKNTLKENATLENSVQQYDSAYKELTGQVLAMNAALEQREIEKQRGAEKSELAKSKLYEARANDDKAEHWASTTIPGDFLNVLHRYESGAGRRDKTTTRRIIDRIQETIGRKAEN